MVSKESANALLRLLTGVSIKLMDEGSDKTWMDLSKARNELLAIVNEDDKPISDDEVK